MAVTWKAGPFVKKKTLMLISSSFSLLILGIFHRFVSKWWVIFLERWAFNRFFLKLNRSSVTRGRPAPIHRWKPLEKLVQHEEILTNAISIYLSINPIMHGRLHDGGHLLQVFLSGGRDVIEVLECGQAPLSATIFKWIGGLHFPCRVHNTHDYNQHMHLQVSSAGSCSRNSISPIHLRLACSLHTEVSNHGGLGICILCWKLLEIFTSYHRQKQPPCCKSKCENLVYNDLFDEMESSK